VSDCIVWVTGGSGGIGSALIKEWIERGSKVVSVSRRAVPVAANLNVDLADPTSWQVVGEDFRARLAGFEGQRAILLQAAGTLDPVGFAGEVDTSAYVQNVMVNSAAFQVLGHLFLSASRHLFSVRRQLVILSSGAARTVYPGWSSYGAAKAAVDQWVRNVAAEQQHRGGAEVVSIAPGTIDTAMQSTLRRVAVEDFPAKAKFVDLYERGGLAHPVEAAKRILALLDGPSRSGEVLDLRDLP